MRLSLPSFPFADWLRAVAVRPGCLAAGFPSVADDYAEPALNLHTLLVPRPGATFFMRAEGISLPGEGILAGDLLVVDRSLEARPGRIIVAVVNGVLRLRRLGRETVGNDAEVVVWGVVTHAIHTFPGAQGESGGGP